MLDDHRARLPVTFIALTEAHVLNALRQAGRPHRIRPALTALEKSSDVSTCLVRANCHGRHRRVVGLLHGMGQ